MGKRRRGSKLTSLDLQLAGVYDRTDILSPSDDKVSLYLGSPS